MKTRIFAAASAGLGGAVLAAVLFAQEAATYVATRKIDHMDDYHGTKVADPYRWLEDETSPQTAAWIEAQNAVTFPYLERIPYREALRARVMELNDYERYGAPARKGPYFFFSKNEGLQNQSVLYLQEGLDGSPDVLLDPNAWSGGTVQLSAFEPSKTRSTPSRPGNARLAAVQSHGTATKRTLEDNVSGEEFRSPGTATVSTTASEPPEAARGRRSTRTIRCSSTGSARRRRPIPSFTRIPRIRSASMLRQRPRTSASRSSRCPTAAKASTATRCTFAT
jgi:hypothetical protein